MTSTAQSWLGYVTGVDPLRVRRDYPTSLPPPAEPLSLVADLQVGDKVYIQEMGHRWIVVGKVNPAGNPDPVPLTLINGHTNYVSTGYAPPSARMIPGGLVLLSGRVNLSARTDTTLAVLPEGFRPQYSTILQPAGASGSTALSINMDVLVDGTIRVVRPAVISWISLDGLMFPAYQ